ncbi:uncharacterized protein [Macrobrachium rosenbergii]|uniref:uncharacterized protein n=1 Tax=Macrobrachium rosenbergii TaxID=79674 RepID=UPI0034D5E5C3
MHSWLRVLVLISLAVVAVTALEEDTQAEEVQEVEEDVDFVDNNELPQGRTLSEWSESFWRWMGYDYDYYEEDYDNNYFFQPASPQIGYGLPAVGYLAPSGGSPHSSYSSYVPVHAAQQSFAHPARDDDYDEDSWSMTDMLFDMAITVVPIGLLLSALPTGLFTFAIRRRSFDDSNLLMDSLEPTEVNRIISLLKSDLTDRRCQEELFCEISKVGEYDDASYLQKAFYYISTLTPDFLASRFGVGRLFRTTRSGYCQALQCPSKPFLEPPKITHEVTDTNLISEVVTDAEKEATEVSKE